MPKLSKLPSGLLARKTTGMGMGLYWRTTRREFDKACTAVGPASNPVIGRMQDPVRVRKAEWNRYTVTARDGDGDGAVGLKVFNTTTGAHVRKYSSSPLTRSDKVLCDDVGIVVNDYVYYDRSLTRKMTIAIPPPGSSSGGSIGYVGVPRSCNWYRLNHLNEPNVSIRLEKQESGRTGIAFYWNRDTPPSAGEQIGFSYGDVPLAWGPPVVTVLPTRTRSGVGVAAGVQRDN
jgi:hypothetical protein